jgi:hypothetical protein
MDVFIENLNNADLGWKADICKLQKHHHMYDKKACEAKNNNDGPVSLAQIVTTPEQAEADEAQAFMEVASTVKSVK